LRRERVKLLPSQYDVVCNEVEEEYDKMDANSEVDRLGDVGEGQTVTRIKFPQVTISPTAETEPNYFHI
jgi:hypothetical protein